MSFGTILPLAAKSAQGHTDWSLIVSIVAAGAAAISAVGVILGGIYWLRTRSARRERARREAELTEDVEQLNELMSSFAAEMRGRAPRPKLQFGSRDGPTDSVIVSVPAVPAVDVEAIVSAEREAVLGSRPPLDDLTAEEMAGLNPLARGLRVSSGLERKLGISRYRAVTREDYAEFDKVVEKYEHDVRAFVEDWLGYLGEKRVALWLWAQVENSGGAPAEKAKIRLRFPDPCTATDPPERPKLPERPRFKRKLNPLHPDAMRISVPDLFPRFRSPDVGAINLRRDHSGPHYKKGSLEVSYEYDLLPHHEPVELEAFVVGIPEPGDYEVAWTIGASNLVERAHGVLQLRVDHEPPTGAAVTTIGDLVGARHSRES